MRTTMLFKKITAMLLAIILVLLVIDANETMAKSASTKSVKIGKVTSVKAVLSGDIIKLSWKKAKNVAKYEIHRSNSKRGEVFQN